MKNALTLLAIASLVGCGGYSTVEKSPFTKDLAAYSLAKVSVSAELPEGADAANRFQDKMVGELLKGKVFPACSVAEDGKADVKISVTLATHGHRVAADVKVADVKSGQEIGAFSVDGKSSSWSSAGHAVDKTAIAVVEYLAKQR